MPFLEKQAKNSDEDKLYELDPTEEEYEEVNTESENFQESTSEDELIDLTPVPSKDMLNQFDEREIGHLKTLLISGSEDENLMQISEITKQSAPDYYSTDIKQKLEKRVALISISLVASKSVWRKTFRFACFIRDTQLKSTT